MDESGKKNVYYLAAAGVLASLVFLYLARRVVTPFFIAFALAYLLDPLVDRLEKLKISRTFAVLLLMFLLFGAFLLGAVVFVPMLQAQARQLTENLPDYIGAFQGWLRPLLDEISGLQSAQIQEIMNEGLKKFGELPLQIVTRATSLLWGSISSLFNILLVAFNAFIVPVATFYLLRDFDRINEKLLNLVPPRFRDKTREIILEIDAVLSRFARGQLMVAALMAALYSAGLYLCGTPLSFFIGGVAGFANMVPYLGLVFGFLPAAALTFLQYREMIPVAEVAAVFAAVHALEGMVISPRVLGGKIGLHPVAIMMAVLVGAEFFGLLGVFLAVPVAAVLNVLARRGLARYKKSPLYS